LLDEHGCIRISARLRKTFRPELPQAMRLRFFVNMFWPS
jgi:hypothetical protein